MTTSQPHKTIRLFLLIMILTVIQFSCNSRIPSQTDPNSIATIVAGTLSAIPSTTPAPNSSSTPDLPTASPTVTFALTVNGQLQGTLAFIRNYNLWVSINGVESQLTTDAISTKLGSAQLWYSNPQISPDGTQVLYVKKTSDVSTYSYTSTLMVSDIDGKNAHQLVSDVAGGLWSNDSQKIYYPVSNGFDTTTGFETIVLKSLTLNTGDVVDQGQYAVLVGCGGGGSDRADHVSGNEGIGYLGKGQIFTLSPQNNYVMHSTSCSHGLGIFDLSTKQDIILDDGNVYAAAISADGVRIAAASENNIMIVNLANGTIEQILPTSEPPRALLWDNNGTAVFYSTSKSGGTQKLDETIGLEVFNNPDNTITLYRSTLWKISLSNGESIKIIDMDAHDLKPIFARDQTILVAAIENTNVLFDYLTEGNRENIAEHYPSVNLVEIDLATLTFNIVMHKTTQADYVWKK